MGLQMSQWPDVGTNGHVRETAYVMKVEGEDTIQREDCLIVQLALKC